MRNYPGLFLLLIIGLSACISPDATYSKVAPGIWRGALELEHFTIPARKKKEVTLLYDQIKPGELPFNFEIKYLDNDRFYVEFINGSERIRVDSIQYGRDRSLARDTMNIWFPEYQSYIHAEIRGGVMQGYWRVLTREDYQIPFYAHAGRDYRFTTMEKKPLADLSGDWATFLGVEKTDEDPERAVAEFKQDGNHLEGTFRTETGDYRFLEGTIQDRDFWLSCFDGAHAFLFSGAVQGDSLQGEFCSGTHYKTLWTSWQSDDFELTPLDSISQVKSGQQLSFSVKTPEGKEIKYPSSEFDGKLKIFTISGTWCPNCKDELLFLTEFMKENPDLANKMAVVSFSFERAKDESAANMHLIEYKKKLNLPFDIVYAGVARKEVAEEFFPALNKVISFPTMIILDKNDKVLQVHTGFDGPATSRYESFKKHFADLVNSALQ